MSASHTRPRYISSRLSMFGLALGLVVVAGLSAVLHAGAAAPPDDLARPAATGLAAPGIPPPSGNLPAPSRAAPTYRPPSGRSTMLPDALVSWSGRADSRKALMEDSALGGHAGLVHGREVAPAAIAASKVITFDLSGAVYGYTDADSPVHLQLTRGGTPVGEARGRSDSQGYFHTELMHDGRYASVQPGDMLQVNATTDAETLTAPNVTGTVSPGPDSVAGQITGVPLPAQLRLEAWGNILLAATNAAGRFTADFTPITDLTWFTEVRMSYQDADGDWLTAWLYPKNGMVINSQRNGVYGYADPMQPVSVTVGHNGVEETQSLTTDARTGWWALSFNDIAASDVVTATVGGSVIVADIPGVTAVGDAALDRITGTAPAATELAGCQWLLDKFTARIDCRTSHAGPGGAYTVGFPAGQLTAASSLYVFPHITTEADLYLYANPPFAQATWGRNAVYGYAAPNALMTVTLSSGVQPLAIIETIHTTTDASGSFQALFTAPFQDGYQALVDGGGINTVIQLAELSIHTDVAADRISGRAPASADLALSAYTGGKWGISYRSDATANASGDYQLDLAGVLDLRNGGESSAELPQGNDEDQPAWLGAWCYAPFLTVNETHNDIGGGVDAPHVPVTLTLKTAAGAIKGAIHTNSDASCAFEWQQFTDEAGRAIDIAPGDRVVVEEAGWSQEVVTIGMDVIVDAATDRVTGVGPANSFVEVQVRWAWPVLRVPTGADGAFVADFTGLVDITGGGDVQVNAYDANWNVSHVVGQAPYARANMDWDSMDGWFGPGVAVQYTVTDGTGVPKGGAAGVAREDGWLDGIGCGCDMVPGDRVIVHSDAGFDTDLVLIPITGAVDVAADRVSGQMFDGVFPGQGVIWIWSPTRNEGRGQKLGIDAAGNFIANFAAEFDIRDGDSAEVWYFDANRNQVGIMLYTPYLQVRANRAHDWVQGDATSQTTVFVTVTRSGQVIGTGQSFTGGGTWYHVNPQRPEGGNVDMRTGDIVDVTAGALTASVLLIDMDAAVNATTDVVSGKLAGVPFPANVRVEVWRDNGESRDLQTDAAGNFTVDFGAFDIHQGDTIGIWYVRPDGHMAGIARAEFRIEVELRDNDLWGIATPRGRVDVEVRAPSGALKAKTTAWADQEGNYGSDLRDAAGQRIDIQPGDIIKGVCGTRQATAAILTPFSATYDPAADTVCGQAPDGTRVQVDLWGYGTQYPTADAANTYCATFDGDPGIETEGEVRTDLPAGHTAFIRFRTPAPNLWLEKWSDGQPPSGGYHRYNLRVGNGDRADLPATNVIVTDTLPSGMTYVSASPAPASTTGGRVVWNLGTIALGAQQDLTLLVRVASSVSPGQERENCAETTAAGWEGYRWDNTACDRQTVTERQADLWIGGWMSPGDPAPGGEYIYHLDYGNGRAAGSRNVQIMDTLPAGTTLVSEWHPEGWTVDTSQAGQVIWQTDYLPGWSGRYLELHLRVDGSAAPGATQLHNRAEISGEAPDADANNNVWENDAGVQSPYSNVSVGKGYVRGIPVAGYEYTTWVNVWNHGNTHATGAVLTDTLPAGATFVRATQYQVNPATGDSDRRSDFPPSAQGPGWVRWDLPPISNWRECQLEVTFRIAAGAAAGTELVNQADVTLADDRDPNNNRAAYEFRTQAPGPNLRVSKWYEWGDLAPGNTIQYRLQFENDGTEPIYDLVLRDILPDHTALNGWGWEEPAIAGNILTWAPQWQQNPGDQLGFWLQVRVDDGTPAGTVLTNTADGATNSAEVTLTDNSAAVTLLVGPDLRVEKELLDQIRPGYRARYRIRIWNDGRAWARNVVLTDTLPDGLTFAGSWWGGNVQGNQVIWNLGDLHPGWYNDFELEVEAARDLAAGSVVINRVDIANNEGDARPADNTFTRAAIVASPYSIRVQESHNWVNGNVLPNAHVVVVLRDSSNTEKTRYETDAGGDGYFWAPLNQNIMPGDQVNVDTEGTPTIALPVVRIDGAVSAAADRITGKVYDVPYPAQIRGEIWAENGTKIEGQTTNTGTYNLSFAPFNVRTGHEIALWYVRPDGHEIGIVRSALFVRVYPTGDWLWGSTTPATVVTITLRDAANNVKGTATVISGSDGDWDANVTNDGAAVEIDDGDKVRATTGSVTANLVVPRITVLPDAPHDRLEIYSELPNTPLDIRWDSEPGQAQHDLANGDRVTTDAAGYAAFDFGPHGSLPLEMTGNLYYYDAEGQCIEPWWRAMVDAVAPTAITNAADRTLTITGASFQATPAVFLAQDGVTKAQLTGVALVGGSGNVLQVTVPAGTPPGVYDLHVYNPDEFIGFLADTVTISYPTPVITSIAPAAGFFDETISFSITGSNFVAGAAVSFTDGAHVLTPVSVVVVSSGQITGELDLHGAAPGRYDAVVKSPGPGEPASTLDDGFQVKSRWRIRLPLVLRNP